MKNKMGGRYFITGSQLGILMVLDRKDEKQRMKILQEIMNDQFIGIDGDFKIVYKKHV
jgi:hypothetical protein